jgi:hypothetical protein
MFSRPIRPSTFPTATTLPYDILREIFLHCLPDDRLDNPQPNSSDPPMLLCYVCSYWRKVTLASPSLWSHIFYRLPIRWDIEGRPIIWDLNRFMVDMKFLNWWRRNQGSMAPFIRFQFYQERDRDLEHKESYMDGDIMKFFIDYLSSAQYLDVGPFARYLFRQDSASGFPVASPNLHTLVAYYEDVVFADILGQTVDPTLTRILPFHIASSLRRLSIHFEGNLSRTFMNSFSNWSGLTHLSMHKMTMSPNVWFSLIRGAVHLQWGFFWIAIREDEDDGRIQPSRKTLPFLSTLSLQAFHKRDGHSEFETLGSLLQDLHLPALHNLTLYLDVNARNLPHDVMKINTMLKPMPAVQDLTLGLRFYPSFDPSLPNANWQVSEKLSTLASSLTHLQLDMTYTYRYSNINNILSQWKEILSPGRWLDLADPTNPIRKITAFVPKPRTNRPLADFFLRNTLALGDEEQGKTGGVVLEVFSVEKPTDASEKWKTWGAR